MAIKIKHNDKEYLLEFNRNAIVKLERDGFNISQVEERPLSSILYLFNGAFIMHHPKATEKEIDEIFSNIPEDQRPALMQALITEYSKPIDTLFKPVGDNTGNVTWEVVKK